MKRLWVKLQGGPLVVLLLTLLLAAAAGILLDQHPASAAPPLQGRSAFNESCGNCHVDHKVAWETGVHAIAFDRESFQEAWASFNNPDDCLLCHTTDYDEYAEKYYAKNVVCEACHGMTPDDHPPQDLQINRNASMCGQCHVGTFSEWRVSPHAFTEDMGTVACSTCHNPHGQVVRFDTVDALCLDCHGSAPNTYVHLTHNEIEFADLDVDVDLTCATCHMYRTQGLGDGTRDDVVGHNIPNHTMAVKTDPCTQCHEALSTTGAFPILVDVDTVLAAERDELRTRVSDLEAALEVAENREAPAAISYVQLTQGLIIGLGVGITLAWVLARRDSGANRP